MKYTGTIVRGIKAPIIKEGDNIIDITIQSLQKAAEEGQFVFQNHDVVTITEAVVARSQGNYATVDQMATDIKAKFPRGTVGLILPILSRNRFSLILQAIKQGVEKLVIQLSYPCDEVGNPLMDLFELEENAINPYIDVFTYQEFRKFFPKTIHPFTGLDYIEYYREIGQCEIILANDPTAILQYTNQVIVGSIHSRDTIKNKLLKKGAKTVYKLDEILTKSVNGSGYHPDYGLLGSNMATAEKVKLFPRDCQPLVNQLQAALLAKFNVTMEVMVYGDGAFKDPVGGIWELADPVVSPGYTAGLNGTPSELKLKYLADNILGDASGEEAVNKIKDMIRNKKANNDNNLQLGTTPRRITDLLGSLSDLTSGSGDKGTPIVLIQNYFNNYGDE